MFIKTRMAILLMLLALFAPAPGALGNAPVQATFIGRVFAGPGFTPVVGMTVTAMIDGVQCGSSQTIASGSDIWYNINVTGDTPQCGASGRKVTFWISPRVMAPTVTWEPMQTMIVAITPANRVYADPAGLCGGNFPCIKNLQSATNAVADTGEVIFYPGTYGEACSLTRNVTVSGLGNATLSTFSQSAGIFIAPSTSLTLTGNLSLTGGEFRHNNGSLVFAGSGVQTLAFGEPTPLNNLMVRPGAVLYETSPSGNVTIGGTLNNQGTIRYAQIVGAVNTYHFGLTGAMFVITNPLAPTLMHVDRVGSAHPFENANLGGSAILDTYYNLAPGGALPSFEVCLAYTDAELHTASTASEGDLSLCRWNPAAPAGWACQARAALSSVAENRVCAENVDHFSDWVIGDVGPTAVQMGAFRAKLVAGISPAWLMVFAGLALAFWLQKRK